MANRNTKQYRKLAAEGKETPKGTCQGYRRSTGKGNPCNSARTGRRQKWQGHPAVSALNRKKQLAARRELAASRFALTMRGKALNAALQWLFQEAA